MRTLSYTIAIVGSFALGFGLRKPAKPPDVPDRVEPVSPPAVSGVEPTRVAPADSQGQYLDETRCNWLLHETGVDIPGWLLRIAIAVATIACVGGLLLAVAAGASGRPLWITMCLSVASGVGFVVVLQIVGRRLIITETPRSGFWPSAARHLNRWLQLAGPRLTVSILTFLLSVVFLSWAAQPNIADLDLATYAGVASALWVISGTALVTIFFEYRRQLRLLRRSAEPTIVALRNNIAVPPEEVSRLLMSLSYGVATAHTETVGLIDASRARSAVAIYSETRSPAAIQSIITEASARLSLSRPMDETLRERFLERTVVASDPAERLRANEILGHTTSTAETRRIIFGWLNEGPTASLPIEELISTLPPAAPSP